MLLCQDSLWKLLYDIKALLLNADLNEIALLIVFYFVLSGFYHWKFSEEIEIVSMMALVNEY
jgi:hypothetical protein